MTQPGVIIVMGVSGAGKTTVGKMLAKKLSWQFADADDFHSAANKAKMHAGTALTDEDRRPWLEGMAAAIKGWLASGANTVLACSALKDRYRLELTGGNASVLVVYLKADFAVIEERLSNRSNHFMNKELLASQFATLEEPAADAHTLVVDASEAPAQIVQEVRSQLSV